MSSREKTNHESHSVDFEQECAKCINVIGNKQRLFDRIGSRIFPQIVTEDLVKIYDSLLNQPGQKIGLEDTYWNSPAFHEMMRKSGLDVRDMRYMFKEELAYRLRDGQEKSNWIHKNPRLVQVPCERVVLQSITSNSFCAKIPLLLSKQISGEEVYFLPPSAVRRRKKSPLELHYAVKTELIKSQQRKWRASVFQVNNTGQVAEIGSVVIVDADGDGVGACIHSTVFRPVEFCIDEVMGRLFAISYKKTKACIALVVVRLKIMSKTTRSCARVQQIEHSLKTYKNALPHEKKPRDLVGLSHFAISPEGGDEVRFIVGFQACTATVLNQAAASTSHTEIVVVDMVFVEESPFGLLTDWSCSFFRGMTLAAAGTPSLWQVHENLLIGQLNPSFLARNEPIDDTENAQRIFRFAFGDTGPPQMLNQVYALLNFAGISSLPKDANFRMLLIGKVGKYLVFADTTHAAFLVGVRMLTDRPSNGPHDRANFVFRHVLVDMSSVELAGKSLSSLTNTVRWIDFGDNLYIQAEDKLYSVAVGKAFRNARRCATCDKVETFKRKNKSGQPISQFKVCKICKNLEHHKYWWVYPCHFCSSTCFKNGWKKHVQHHVPYSPN